MKNPIYAFALFAITAAGIAVYPSLQTQAQLLKPLDQPLPVTNEVVAKPVIEVVFVLDTTSSMTGLIDAAKENIWSIASNMAASEPTPDFKMGLVAFRDRGDQYVTQVIDLSSDLDSMYAKLMDFKAQGGGDTPESVNQALHQAVTEIQWSSANNSYKTIFLVGDAPANDYPDDVDYPESLKLAQAKGIVINTIQAGNAAATRAQWMQIAQLNQGQYFQVAQSGNAIAVKTPFDDKIAKLSAKLDGTRLYYGSEQKRAAMAAKEAATDKLQAHSSPAALAKRATFNASSAGKKNFVGDNELVDDVLSGAVELDDLNSSELPEPLQSISQSERADLVKQKAEQRSELQTEIRSLAEQRQAYIAEQLKQTNEEAESLDYKVFSAVKAQAADKGLHYKDAPRY